MSNSNKIIGYIHVCQIEGWKRSFDMIFNKEMYLIFNCSFWIPTSKNKLIKSLPNSGDLQNIHSLINFSSIILLIINS